MKSLIILSLLFSLNCFGQSRSSCNEFCGGCLSYMDSVMNHPRNTYVGDLVYRPKQGDTVITDYFLTNINDCHFQELYVSGLKSIRHDALLYCKFRYAHEIKREIKKLEQ